MRAAGAVGIAILVATSAIEVIGQTTQPAVEREWFIETTAERTEGNVIKKIVRCDPSSGRRTVLSSFDTQIILHSSVMDIHGRPLGLRRTGDSRRSQGRIELVTPLPGGPNRVFEEMEVKRMSPVALSPDGRRIVFFDYEDGRIVVGDETSVHVLPTEWRIAGHFSWSPDSSRVAFYYADSMEGDDIHVQEHGVAVLSADGQLKSVVAASEVFGTPRSMGKHIPPGWGRSGRFVYYTTGTRPELPGWDQKALRSRSRPHVTCRVDINTGRSEKLGDGDFASVSPDESYVLLCPFMRSRDAGERPGITTIQVAVETKQVTRVLDEMLYPKISPSGKLVAALARDFNTIRFFRTADWEPQGQPVVLDMQVDISPDEWGPDFRWIVVDEKPAGAP